jgi:hypothetical protein
VRSITIVPTSGEIDALMRDAYCPALPFTTAQTRPITPVAIIPTAAMNPWSRPARSPCATCGYARCPSLELGIHRQRADLAHDDEIALQLDRNGDVEADRKQGLAHHRAAGRLGDLARAVKQAR